MIVQPGYLTSLYGSSATGDDGSLLRTLYGYGSQTANGNGLTPVQSLDDAERNHVAKVKAVAVQTDVKRTVTAFRTAVAGAKTVDALLRNPAIMKVLLTANGLADQIPYAALARKALTANPDDAKSLLTRLSDTRWKAVAKTYDFAKKGLSVIKDPKVLDTLAQAYAEITWRRSLDAATPGLSNALTFRAEASKITSVLQILGDKVMREVVTGALGVPKEIAFQPLTAQENAISTRVDVKKFQDPKFVEAFVRRYLLSSSVAKSASPTADLSSLAVQAGGLVI